MNNGLYLKPAFHRRNNHPGFTLIELLIVIAIIGVLSTLAIIALNSSRAGARDSKRISDVRNIATALQLYYADHQAYPAALTPGQPLTGPNDEVYMSSVPRNPSPRTDGGCPDTEYSYATNNSNTLFALGFCLGAAVSSLPAGIHTATPEDGVGNWGLVGWWKLNEGSGTTTADSSGKGATGTLTNGPTWVTKGSGSYAVEFDGADDYITLASPNQNLQQGGTIAAWIYPESAGGGAAGRILDKSTGDGGQDGFRFSMNNNRVRLAVNNGNAANTAVDSIPFNQWSFVAFTWDAAGNVTRYLDGETIAGAAATGAATGIIPTTAMRIGNRVTGSSTTGFDGSISDLRLYGRILSAAEIKALYKVGQ